MGAYSVPVVIGVDEDRIAQEIEKDVERKVVEYITKEIKGIIFDSYYGHESNEPLRRMITDRIGSILREKEDVIVREAADILAEKMARTKVVREATKEVVEKSK